jgi:hypothetical protein
MQARTACLLTITVHAPQKAWPQPNYRVHDALAQALKGEAELPVEMQQYAAWVDRVKRGAGKLYVEQKYAINRQFQKTTYFADDVWYRGVGDVVRIAGNLALVLDWKTGKILEDSVQLMLMAQCLFSHYCIARCLTTN